MINYKFEEISLSQLTHHFDLISKELDYSNDFIKEWIHKMHLHALFITAKDENNVLKGIIAFYANRGREAYITHIWVEESTRGQGICGGMMNKVDQIVSALKFSTIRLEVRKNNNSAIRAYLKNGYEISEEKGLSYYMTKKL